MPTQITQLTAQQQQRLASYCDRWISIGLSIDRANRGEAEDGVRKAYQIAGLEPPHIFVWLDSPYQGCIGAYLLSQVSEQVGAQISDQVRAQVLAQVRAQVWAQVWAQVRAQVGAQVWAQVRAQVRGQVRGQVGAKVRAQVRGQVWAQISDQVRAQVLAQISDQVRGQVGAKVRAQVLDQLYQCGYGSHDVTWLAFYQFFEEVCQLDMCKRLDGLMHISLNAGWWWPFEHVCLLTERPSLMRRDASHRLHCDDGPALQYPDGFSLWCLHGVRVPEWLVTTPAEHLDPRRIAEIENVEVKAAFVRRVGVDRLCHSLRAHTLDTLGDYALLRLDIGDGRDRRYLKMLNPSVPGLWHVEEVRPSCRTVEEALHWREPDALRKIPIDDIDGEDYYQQGDVVLWPAGAKSRKRFPSILT